MKLIRNKKGFTYVDVLTSVAILMIFISILMTQKSFISRAQNTTEELEKMTLVARSVMDIYKVMGKTQALNYTQRYSVRIVEDSKTGFENLVKVTVNVSHPKLGINPVSLVSYITTSSLGGPGGVDISGTGTQFDPYMIWTLGGLDQIRNDLDAYYVLGCDIDASDTINWTNDEGLGFKRIGVYGDSSSITLDGNGHKIINLYINSSSNEVGFIGLATSTSVKNIGFENITVIGNSNVGGIVGYSQTGGITLENCYVTGSISGNSNVAGLVGFGSGTLKNTITNCYVNASITSNDDASGLVCQMANQEITNCYAITSMNSSNKYALGNIIWNPLEVNNSHWNTDISGVVSNLTSTGLAFGEGLTDAQMKQQINYSGWDFSTIWEVNSLINNGYPYLKIFNQ